MNTMKLGQGKADWREADEEKRSMLQKERERKRVAQSKLEHLGP